MGEVPDGAAHVEIRPVVGLPEIRPGDDLGLLIAEHAPWLRDDDVVVVTSKVVSKAEGRLVPAPDAAARDDAIEAETLQVVAQRDRRKPGRHPRRGANSPCCRRTRTPRHERCAPTWLGGSGCVSVWS